MKTKLTTDERITTVYSYDKYPLVILTECKTLDGTQRRLSAARGSNKNEYLKQITLMAAKYPNACEFPYSIDRCDDTYYQDCDATNWAYVLAVSHHKQSGYLSVPKDRFAEFEADVLGIDFRVFDKELADKLSKKYSMTKSPAVKAEIDEIALVESENEA